MGGIFLKSTNRQLGTSTKRVFTKEEIYEEEFTKHEIKHAITCLENNKTASVDGASAELIKAPVNRNILYNTSK